MYIPLWLKLFSHCVHLYGFSNVCFLICIVRFPLKKNFHIRMSQTTKVYSTTYHCERRSFRTHCTSHTFLRNESFCGRSNCHCVGILCHTPIKTQEKISLVFWSARNDYFVDIFTSHRTAFSPVCIRLWIARLPGVENDLPQSSHCTFSLSVVCFFLCMLQLPGVEKTLLQMSHLRFAFTVADGIFLGWTFGSCICTCTGTGWENCGK